MRRAIQLGLRNTVRVYMISMHNIHHIMFVQVLRKYGNEWIAKIEDITEFVHEQYKYVLAKDYESLSVSEERVFTIDNQDILRQLKMEDNDTLPAD